MKNFKITFQQYLNMKFEDMNHPNYSGGYYQWLQHCRDQRWDKQQSLVTYVKSFIK